MCSSFNPVLNKSVEDKTFLAWTDNFSFDSHWSEVVKVHLISVSEIGMEAYYYWLKGWKQIDRCPDEWISWTTPQRQHHSLAVSNSNQSKYDSIFSFNLNFLIQIWQNIVFESEFFKGTCWRDVADMEIDNVRLSEQYWQHNLVSSWFNSYKIKENTENKCIDNI